MTIVQSAGCKVQRKRLSACRVPWIDLTLHSAHYTLH